jgi:hypothetical protein
MSIMVTFDELRLVILVAADLDAAVCDAIRRILESRSFRAHLRRAVRQVLQRHPELAEVRVRVSG